MSNDVELTANLINLTNAPNPVSHPQNYLNLLFSPLLPSVKFCQPYYSYQDDKAYFPNLNQNPYYLYRRSIGKRSFPILLAYCRHSLQRVCLECDCYVDFSFAATNLLQIALKTA